MNRYGLDREDNIPSGVLVPKESVRRTKFRIETKTVRHVDVKSVNLRDLESKGPTFYSCEVVLLRTHDRGPVAQECGKEQRGQDKTYRSPAPTERT